MGEAVELLRGWELGSGHGNESKRFEKTLWKEPEMGPITAFLTLK